MTDLSRLFLLGLDNFGTKTNMPVQDAIRLIISSYKAGYKDGVNDSQELVNVEKTTSTNKTTTEGNSAPIQSNEG